MVDERDVRHTCEQCQFSLFMSTPFLFFLHLSLEIPPFVHIFNPFKLGPRASADLQKDKGITRYCVKRLALLTIDS
jgi:hypothetical protein